ncbi:MAG: hypothetical protein H7177_03415 [Rhizobacter sp.]|nr:hypothetical protein [Bacteriovorax sp.]
MAMIGVGALSYVVLTRGRSVSKLDIRRESELELTDAITTVGTLFISPANCNANFYLMPFTGSLTTAINRCASGSCRGTTPGGVPIPIANPSNNTSVDWLTSATGLSPRVRVIGVTYRVDQAQAQAPQQAARLEITVTFQRSIGVKAGSAAFQTVNEVKLFQAFVKTASWTHPDPNPANPGVLTLNPANLIYGCTKSPNSSGVY